jgi:hypothetical protein
MKLIAIGLTIVAILSCQTAAAINKCTNSDGKVTFQDAPCASGRVEVIEVRPSSGSGVRAAPSAAAASAPASITEAARLESIIAASQRSRRSLDLRERLLPGAERGLKDHRDACEEKQKALAKEQYTYAQNLYGKTHAAQIASEMAAAAATCDRKDRELKETLDVLQKECSALHCRT